MTPFIRNVSFHSINLVGLLTHDLAKCSSVMQEVVSLFRQNIAKPIHPTTFMPFSQIEEGFRLMQMGKHVGKIVFEVGDNDLVPVCSDFCMYKQAPKIDPYLGHPCSCKTNQIRCGLYIPPQRGFGRSGEEYRGMDGPPGCEAHCLPL